MAIQSLDFLNDIEEDLVTVLKGDAWLGNRNNVKTLESKYNQLYVFNNIAGIKTPAVFVFTVGMDTEDFDTTKGVRSIPIEVNFAIVEQNKADWKRADQAVKEIVTRLHYRLWVETSTASKALSSGARVIQIGPDDMDYRFIETDSVLICITTCFVEMRILNS